MEPVTTAAAVSTVVGYLAKKIKDNKSIQSFLDDFTEATVNWIRPIFLEDDKPKEVLRDLEAKPESTNRQEAMKNKIAIALEDNPSAEKLIYEMVAIIEAKKAKGEVVTISASKNVNTGMITAGGHVTLGDNSNVNK